MDYKETLNLPKTAFPMKGNLPQTEPKILAAWQRMGLYAQILTQRAEGPIYILHDGPPYANGDIHMGHALNKVLKDFIVRFKILRGHRAAFVPGWDCHGLPIEYALMRQLGVNKHEVDVVAFRKQARAYALRYVDLQREQFKRLGCLGDWDHPYLTLDSRYVAQALYALADLAEAGYIYRDRKPVNWCWSCETALAEAEVEYEPHRSPSIAVKFRLLEESAKRLGVESAGLNPRQIFLVIWTTTPWTLVGNVAVAVHPEFRYALYPVGSSGEGWIVLETVAEPLANELSQAGLLKGRVIQSFLGSQMEGWTYHHPLWDRQGRVVLADYVSDREGTGLVHIAPGFGAEDHATGKAYGLHVLAPVDERGRFVGLSEGLEALNGKQVQSANPQIIQRLKTVDALVWAGSIEHSYPHCWRCHEPIIFRATDQWFLSLEHRGLRKRLKEVVMNEVRWIPGAARERMLGMLKDRPDWCLSRQRLWGIPIPAVMCKGCGEGILDPEVVRRFAKAVEEDPEGSDLWFTEPVGRWIPPGWVCPRCGGNDFQPGRDILDVWFDSGISHRSVLDGRSELRFPADLYLEGSDQHRGWFQVSLITAVALRHLAPYRAVLTHGFVVDGEGRKMSKSLGNVIAPQEVVAQYGADLLRLWVASSDYAEDIRLSERILAQVAEMYRKIRNTWRFCLANLFDYDPTEPFPYPSMQELDRWALSVLATLVRQVTQAYEDHAYHRVCRLVHEFCTVTLSNFYLDVLKDRLYTYPPNDPARRSAQAALFQLVRTLIIVMAPILPMTAEEAWAALPFKQRPIHSVHLEDWPLAEGMFRDEQAESVWNRLIPLRDRAMKALEEARMAGKIGDALEAVLELEVGDGWWELLNPRQSEFADACVVSGLVLKRGPSASLTISVHKAQAAKCERCWKRVPSVGQSLEHPNLCGRCVDVVRMWYTKGLR
jgi:isoleucyl-tRNA synthetase